MWHNHLLKLKNISYNNKRESLTPIFTGYYGMPNINQHEQYVSFNNEKGYRAPSQNELINRNTLYQKTSSKKNNRLTLNRDQLYQKYKNQKKAESEFYILQSQISQTENLIATNPHLASYYAVWMQQAKETLKEYTNIIESPDNVSFSSVYGYSKDEELITLYRNPQFSSELNRIQTNSKRMSHDINSVVPYFNGNSSNIYRYSFNTSRNFKKNSSFASDFNFSNRSLQLIPVRNNRSYYFRNVISNDECQNF
ncbi:unnamed protein product [Brachionus calyciflorus]|uniref:Uncharacterized protein n=1 Tax=Brachionus calyciflorus TaxID=104777 RepID=A0A814F1R3_9BILA|nr:unnamed protein product [Brachionus calyciflorus]